MSVVRKEVLIVDDDPELRAILRRILENLGINVCEADGVQAAIEKYNERSPHLVITDLEMKPESGYVLLVHLKSISGVMPVPVIVLSAKDDQKSIQQAMNLGISEFVTKPLNAAKFIQKIRKNIRGEEIARHTFPAGSPCSVNVSLPGRIVAASEIGFRLVTSIRLECQSMVTVKSPFLDQLSIQDYPLKSGPVLAKAFEHGQYNNEIRLAGVTREISNRTRKLMMTWK